MNKYPELHVIHEPTPEKRKTLRLSDIPLRGAAAALPLDPPQPAKTQAPADSGKTG